jgi:hypothetical protein
MQLHLDTQLAELTHNLLRRQVIKLARPPTLGSLNANAGENTDFLDGSDRPTQERPKCPKRREAAKLSQIAINRSLLARFHTTKTHSGRPAPQSCCDAQQLPIDMVECPRLCRRSEGAMPTVEVWVVLDQNGSCEVATDADTALERLIDGSGDDLVGTACRIIRLNVTMSKPRYRDDDDEIDDEIDKTVEVTVPDDAGRIVEIETPY